MTEKYYKSNLFKKDYTFLKNKIFESFITSDEQEVDDSVVEQEGDDSVEQQSEGDSVEQQSEGDSVEQQSDDSVEQEVDDSVEQEVDNSVEQEDTINRVIVSKNINDDNKQIYDYTIKEFYYNFINSTVEITKSIKDSMSNSNLTQAELKPSLIDVLSNKKNLINVGIMLILISIFLSPLLL